jgi:hypothetical protein
MQGFIAMFHVEVRQFPHVARSFNLSEAELSANVLIPWSRGELVLLGERGWEPSRATLTIFEGPELRTSEIGMGRGWGNVHRNGHDVTDRLLGSVREQADAAGAPAATDALAAFKDVVQAQCEANRLAIHQVLWLANSRHPEWRVSERVALSERGVWELLHEGRVRMVRRAAGDEGPSHVDVEKAEWARALLAWSSWSDAGSPRWFLVAEPD